MARRAIAPPNAGIIAAFHHLQSPKNDSTGESRMKRAVLSLSLVALLAGAIPASAQLAGDVREEKYLQTPHRFQLFLDGGIGMPTDPGLFNDFWNTAFQFGIGGGMVIFPWLEVNGTYNTLSFSNNAIASKEKVGYEGVAGIEGGAVHTKMYWASARFIAVPHARTNPYVEIGVGGFKTKADDLTIDDTQKDFHLRNTMNPVSGMTVVPSVGIQYALNERWNAYTKYTYAVNLNGDFAPGDLLLSPGATVKTVGGNQVISAIIVGLMIKF
jgi:opacity protein-like surface antigen